MPGEPNPQFLQQLIEWAQYQLGPVGGMSTGSSIGDLAMQMAVGNNAFLRPQSTQSMLDAAMQRSRNLEFQRIAMTGISSQIAMAHMGNINQNSIPGQIVGAINTMTGGPGNGFISQALAPFVGGNPAIAMQKMYAGLTGMGYGGVGGMGNISSGNTIAAFNQMSRGIYSGLDANGFPTNSTAVNFQSTRGFQLEDYGGAFAAAARHRLFGKGTLEDTAAGFGRVGGRLMDVSREMGLGETGSEIMPNLSNLMGKNFKDLSSDTDVKEVENILRKVKQASRAAGTSIQAIMGIIEEGKQLANAHPALKGIGGLDVIGMTTRATNMATALNATMGGAWMRAHGGTTEVVRVGQQGELEGAAQPIVSQVHALRAYVSGQVGADGKLNARGLGGMAILDKFIAGNDYSVSSLQDLYGNLGEQQGTSQWDLQAVASQAGMTTIGQRMVGADKVSSIGKKAMMQQFKLTVESQGGDWNKFLQLTNGVKGPGLDARVALTQLGSSFLTENANQLMTTVEGTGLAFGLHAGKTLEQMEADADRNVAWEAEWAERFGKNRASIPAKLIASFLSGDLDTKGISELVKGTFMDDSSDPRLGAAILAFASNGGTDTLAEVMGARVGGNVSGSDLDAVMASGKTYGKIMGSSATSGVEYDAKMALTRMVKSNPKLEKILRQAGSLSESNLATSMITGGVNELNDQAIDETIAAETALASAAISDRLGREGATYIPGLSDYSTTAWMYDKNGKIRKDMKMKEIREHFTSDEDQAAIAAYGGDAVTKYFSGAKAGDALKDANAEQVGQAADVAKVTAMCEKFMKIFDGDENIFTKIEKVCTSVTSLATDGIRVKGVPSL